VSLTVLSGCAAGAEALGGGSSAPRRPQDERLTITRPATRNMRVRDRLNDIERLRNVAAP